MKDQELVNAMTECIEREATIKRIEEVYCVGCNSYNGVRCRACGTGDAIDMIEDAPAADVAPVVHGRWENGNPICPVCGGDKFKDLDADIWCDWKPDYCPNCGAKMDGGADHADD